MGKQSRIQKADPRWIRVNGFRLGSMDIQDNTGLGGFMQQIGDSSL